MQKDMTTPNATARKTLSLLRESIRRKGDLPGLASAIKMLEMAEQEEDGPDDKMIQAVMSDPALVQKVLRLANSSMYAAFGGQISSVSRAVALLGTSTIAHIAFSQNLIDNLKPESGSTDETRSIMETAVMAGHVARQVVEGSPRRGSEAPVVCALLHSLGKVLLEFYLPREAAQLKVLTRGDEDIDDVASTALLGLSLSELGIDAAREWGLPNSILTGLRVMAPSDSGEDLSSADWLASVSTLAHQCADVLIKKDGKSAELEVSLLAKSYATMLGTTSDNLMGAVQRANTQAIAEKRAVSGEFDEELIDVRAFPAEMQSILDTAIEALQTAVPPLAPGKAISVTTEALFKATGFSRTFVFIRKDNTFNARTGFGPDSQELLAKLNFESPTSPDALFQALSSNSPMYLPFAGDTDFNTLLPTWWTKYLSDAGSFMIVPLVVNKKTLGFIYGDWVAGYSATPLDQKSLATIEKLRAALIEGMTRSRDASPAPTSIKPPVLQRTVMQAEHRIAA